MQTILLDKTDLDGDWIKHVDINGLPDDDPDNDDDVTKDESTLPLITLYGLNIRIENKKGSVRKGIDLDGRQFEVKMPADYGYIEEAVGNDGEKIDVFIGPNKDSEFVAVIRQRNLVTGGFDEEKVILGCVNKAEAQQLFESAFDDGSGEERIIEIKTFAMEEFKNILGNGLE